jgi:hypothetical protein
MEKQDFYCPWLKLLNLIISFEKLMINKSAMIQPIYKACFLTVAFASCMCATLTAQPAASGEDQFRDFRTEHMWDAKVTIASPIVVGESKQGFRQVIPITGGTFSGHRIKGEVLPGGEDWQKVRPDGDIELYARYLLKTDDGYVIQVINQALMHNYSEGDKPNSYIKSVIDLEAPKGSPYEYLNHAIFIGTLDIPQLNPGEEPYVIIGVYMLL